MDWCQKMTPFVIGSFLEESSIWFDLRLFQITQTELVLSHSISHSTAEIEAHISGTPVGITCKRYQGFMQHNFSVGNWIVQLLFFIQKLNSHSVSLAKRHLLCKTKLDVILFQLRSMLTSSRNKIQITIFCKFLNKFFSLWQVNYSSFCIKRETCRRISLQSRNVGIGKNIGCEDGDFRKKTTPAVLPRAGRSPTAGLCHW